MKKNKSTECDDLLLNAQAELWIQIFSFIKSMTLKCAIELGIPDAIHNHGQPITLTELHSYLSLPASKKPHLSRLLRVLAHSGIFTVQNDTEDKEAVYDLTAVSSLLLDTASSPSLSVFARVPLDSIFVTPTMSLSDWFKQDEQDSFEMVHGCTLFEMSSRDSKFNKRFNDGMASDTSFLMDIIISKHGEVFRGITSLVDVAGGIGCAAKAIAKAFPHVKCTVLDLPHVVGQVLNDGIVKFVSGDMFECVPHADAVLLKWILHDWDDEKCTKILKRCKEAISLREGGKVIVLDSVVGALPDATFTEPQLLLDILMMASTNGIERDEKEWWNIFKQAGFSSYKITPTLGIRSIIEIYP